MTAAVARQVAEEGALDPGPRHSWKPLYWFIGLLSDQPPTLIERCLICKVFRDAADPDYGLLELDMIGGLCGTYVENGYVFYEYTPYCLTTKPEREEDDS